MSISVPTPTFLTRPVKLACLLALAGVTFATPTDAATLVTWTGAGTTQNWSDGSNWSNSSGPANLPISDVTSPSSRNALALVGTGTMNVDQIWTVHNMDFKSGSQLTLQGSTLYFRPIDQHLTSHDTREFLINNSSSTQTIENDIVLQLGGKMTASSGNLVFKGTIQLANEADFIKDTSGPGLRLNAASGKTITIDSTSKLTGAGGDSVAFSGSGTILLKGISDYNRGNSLWNGTVLVATDSLHGQAGAFGAGTGNLVMAANTDSAGHFSPRLLTDAAVTIGRSVTLTSRTQGTGTNNFVIGGNSAHQSYYTGTIRNSSNNSTVANALTVTAAADGRVDITTLLRDTTHASSTDHLTKTGAGIVALTGNATYAGNTLVNQGTLLVNGILFKTATGVSSTGNVQVSSGARLGGTGTIGRSVLISSGGILAPGDRSIAGVESAGNLKIDGNLSLASSTSILNFNLGSTNSDWVTVFGDLDLKGTLNITDAGGFGVGDYKLFDFNGLLSYNTGDVVFGAMINPTLYSYSLDTQSYTNAVYLRVVPEPQMALLASLGLMPLMLRRRRA